MDEGSGKNEATVYECPTVGTREGTTRQPVVVPSQEITYLLLMSKQLANVSQSDKLLEVSEDFLSSLKKTAMSIRADSPNERVSRAPKPSLAEKQHVGKPSSAGAGRRSTADLYLRPTTAAPNAIVSE